jgi:hypothetical protein
LLVQEWNQLSLQEREQVQEEVHGVASYIQEEEGFVNKCLSELDEELRNIRKRTAYDKAFFLNPSYVEDRDFRLMFLRSEYFDAHKAANRLVDHFDLKFGLFGVEKLATDITLEDLPQDALAALNCGSIQNLPGKDRTGRSIICVANKYQKYDSCSLAEVSQKERELRGHLSAPFYTAILLMLLIAFEKVANGLASVYASLGRC